MKPRLETYLMPKLYPLVEELIVNGRVGICAGNMRVVDIQTGACTMEKGPCADRFKLVIPYAGLSVTWEVAFFGDAHFPPDFLFDDKSFKPDLDSIEALNNWQSNNSKSLLQLVQELMKLYRNHQVKQIEGYSRVQFEYNSLTHEAGISSDDVEIKVQKNRNESINFLIKLPVDFSKIPSMPCSENPDVNSAVLLVTFVSPEGKITPQLFLSPRVEESLGGSSSLRIPAFPNGGCLLDYVPNVCQLLTNKVDQIVNGFEKRKDYFSAFLSHYGRSVLEYDATGFTKMSFLMESMDFHFLLTIEVPRYFPQESPVFTFQSVYHSDVRGRPYTATRQDYPYSPRWSGDEMAQRAKLFMLEYIPTFQKNSITRIK